jgi:hypothetical protein
VTDENEQRRAANRSRKSLMSVEPQYRAFFAMSAPRPPKKRPLAGEYMRVVFEILGSVVIATSRGFHVDEALKSDHEKAPTTLPDWGWRVSLEPRSTSTSG